jgi:hypothetical protein
MTSVCRRFRLALQLASMSAGVMPCPSRTQGMPRDGPATLVASTILCDRMPGRAASQWPMKVSVRL